MTPVPFFAATDSPLRPARVHLQAALRTPPRRRPQIVPTFGAHPRLPSPPPLPLSHEPHTHTGTSTHPSTNHIGTATYFGHDSHPGSSSHHHPCAQNPARSHASRPRAAARTSSVTASASQFIRPTCRSSSYNTPFQSSIRSDFPPSSSTHNDPHRDSSDQHFPSPAEYVNRHYISHTQYPRTHSTPAMSPTTSATPTTPRPSHVTNFAMPTFRTAPAYHHVAALPEPFVISLPFP